MKFKELVMTDAEQEKFKIGRRFSSIMNGSVWKIDAVNITDDFLYCSDDHLYACRIFIKDFDKYHYFLDDLTVDIDSWINNAFGPKACECGADKYYGVDQGPHSDYCAKFKK